MVGRQLVGDLRHRHCLLIGRNLRHVHSSLHHLRQDLRHQDGYLLDVLDHARDVSHAVAQLLFPSVRHKDFNHESGFLNALTTVHLPGNNGKI